mmetsp:Transcript_63538/g.151501  ORF Transcript_63538/g.151501 Transcript_63538/m.151501 type:complete len:208 (+) Transcript_63538:109-732(+)
MPTSWGQIPRGDTSGLVGPPSWADAGTLNPTYAHSSSLVLCFPVVLCVVVSRASINLCRKSAISLSSDSVSKPTSPEASPSALRFRSAWSSCAPPLACSFMPSLAVSATKLSSWIPHLPVWRKVSGAPGNFTCQRPEVPSTHARTSTPTPRNLRYPRRFSYSRRMITFAPGTQRGSESMTTSSGGDHFLSIRASSAGPSFLRVSYFE